MNRGIVQMIGMMRDMQRRLDAYEREPSIPYKRVHDILCDRDRLFTAFLIEISESSFPANRALCGRLQASTKAIDHAAETGIDFPA